MRWQQFDALVAGGAAMPESGLAWALYYRVAKDTAAGKKAVELRPNDQIGWTSLSLFYNRNGQIQEAESAGVKARILSWGGKIKTENS